MVISQALTLIVLELKMSLRYILSAIVVLLAVELSAPAFANIQFVSSNGTDSASCSRTTPCQTLGTALNNALPNDTIFCLDNVTSGSLQITKSIDIECSGARAVFRDQTVSGGTAISINIPVSAGDPFRTVRLRGISLFGTQISNRVVPRGIRITSAAVVQLENIVISDMAQQGLLDERTGGQIKLFITDSIFRNNGGVGICACAQGPATVVLDNVRSENNLFGIATASGNSVVINRSVMSGNTEGGVEGDGGAQVVVNNSTISHNNAGVYSNQSIRLSNNDIAFNATAISGPSGTFGNNRFSGNGTMGTAPSALGSASSDLGQQ